MLPLSILQEFAPLPSFNLHLFGGIRFLHEVTRSPQHPDSTMFRAALARSGRSLLTISKAPRPRIHFRFNAPLGHHPTGVQLAPFQSIRAFRITNARRDKPDEIEDSEQFGEKTGEVAHPA